MVRQKECLLKKKQRIIKTCCKELSKAFQYENASLCFLQNNLVTLYIGNIRRSPRETFRLMGKILKAIIPERKLLRSHFKLSNKLVTRPIIVPIRFCPFCGRQLRKDLLINWVKDRKFKNKNKKGV